MKYTERRRGIDPAAFLDRTRRVRVVLLLVILGALIYGLST